MSRTFRTMVWREMREHAGAALFALVGVSLFLLISNGLHRPIVPTSGAVDIEMTTMTVAPAGAVGFGFGLFTLTSALAGLILGRAVTAGDREGDERAFLVHRPVSATEIFFAKAAAAALLYAIAVGIPLIVRTAWNATPAHQWAPYDLRLALPDVADFTAGFAFVAGGMLMPLLGRRVIGRGLLPLGGPLMCSILVVAAHEFWQAELIALVSIVIVGIAAHATFTTVSGYEGESRPARTSLAVNVGLGWQMAGMIVFGIASIFATVESGVSASSTGTAVASTGQLVRVTTQYGAGMRGGPRIVSVTDLSGHPLAEFHGGTSLDTIARGVLSTRQIPLVPENWRSFWDERSYRSTNRVYTPLVSRISGYDPVAWYFVRDRGLAAGYDLRRPRLVGWLGPDGFQPGPEPPRNTFHGDLRPGGEFSYLDQVLAFPHDAYRIDLGHRAVQRMFTAAGGEIVTGASSSGDSVEVFTTRQNRAPQDTSRRFDVIATTRAIYVQSRAGQPLLSFQHDPSVAGYGSVVVSRATDAPGVPTIIRYEARNGSLDRAAERTAPDRAFVLTNGSTTAERVTLPRDAFHGGPSGFNWTVPVVALAMPLAEHVAERVGDILEGNSRDPIDTPAMWTLTILVSLLTAAATIVIGRMYAFSTRRTLLWATGAFLFGFVGLLTMLALVSRPAREPCPACGRNRVVTRDRCEHCGAPFPVPAPDGTEIFEPAAAETLLPS